MPLTVFLTREQADALRSDARVVVRGLCDIGGRPIKGKTESLAQLEEHVKKARSFSELAWWVKQMTRSYASLYEARMHFLQTDAILDAPTGQSHAPTWQNDSASDDGLMGQNDYDEWALRHITTDDLDSEIGW